MIHRHNEVRDLLERHFIRSVAIAVIMEPIVREADPSSNNVGLRLESEGCAHHRHRCCLIFA